MKVIHLIPFDGVGGVERAARTMDDIRHQNLEFNVWTTFPSVDLTKKWILWNPWYFINTMSSLFSYDPDLLIVSLWRSYIVGCFMKILRPKIKLVVFLHSPNHVHFLDRLFTNLACNLAESIWSDSKETMRSRLPGFSTEKSKVISFVTEKIEFQQRPSDTTPKPNFIFWGRLHPQKGLSSAIEIFRSIYKQRQDARFIIIGPDGGDLQTLKKIVRDDQLNASVNFLGSKTFEEIKMEAQNASFYLQTSELEGMAMSVVEAMQLGLVPVVTPVGEIANYCKHNHNAIIVCEISEAVRDITDTLNDKLKYHRLQIESVATWENKSLYKDDIIDACRDLIVRKKSE